MEYFWRIIGIPINRIGVPTVTMIEDLQACKDRAAFASIIGVPVSDLSYALYKMPPENKYSAQCISKKNGGTRNILAPTPKLKFIQRKLLKVLYECEDDIDLAKGAASGLYFGFRRDKDIIDNASLHTRRRFVLNIDIKDFFDQFNFGRVRGYFIKNKDYNLDEKVATYLAQIACFDNKLPQGSPCSPHIANLLTCFFDVRISKFLKKRGCTYSRYCDDISISTSHKIFPSGVATEDIIWPGGWKLSPELESIFEKAGLPINYEKLRMSENRSRMTVTGLTVNKFVNISQDYYNQTRVLCDSYFRNGSVIYKEFVEPFTDNCPKLGEIQSTANNNPVGRLEGRLMHIAHVKMHTDQRTIIEIRANPPQYFSLLQKFVFAKNFVLNKQASVLTEGPSDVLYLKEAIRRKPHLAPHCFDAKNNKFLIKFLRHDGLQMLSVGLDGGSGNLMRFLEMYYRKKNRLNLDLRSQPTIIVLDNDDGCKNLINRMNNVHKTNLKTDDNIIGKKLQNYLYVVKTPQVSGKVETCIEDLLPKSVLNVTLNGKSFNPNEKTFDSTKHFGKIALASYVSKDFSSISFDGFDQFIKALDECVAMHTP
ncbi:retron Ec67 family RNA-directed DNA polymerase/endonuclease [Sphingorhabdus sp.]|uniref:retron Ec67 family RNA-directed DNA polymerase/endonuclease n=1 Tax=Sphingorhabdus sp. TaxID=1902408 RepID=UPI00391A6D73